jgi:hypothetical protein
MLETLGSHSALILGLVISAYTVYSFAETRVIQRRQRYALLRNVRLQSEYFLTLAHSLSSRSDQVVQLYAKSVAGESFPSPAAEANSLSEEAEPAVRWLVSRAEQILAYQINVDIEKMGSFLDKSQIEALLAFMTARRTYTEVLATRLLDLKAFPRKKGVLVRFAGVTALNIRDVNQELDAFGKSLGLQERVQAAEERRSADHPGV